MCIRDRPQPWPPTPGTARIRCEDVSFSYQKKELDLSHISFALEPGETLGIIGPTGAGKSTIVSLLLRLYDADSGRILVDGRDVRSYPLHDLRQKFGVVFQNDALFADSIAENIRLGRQISMEQIRQAAQSAQADFIKGAQGRGFQGEDVYKRQRQRLPSVRANRYPPVLILSMSSHSVGSFFKPLVGQAPGQLHDAALAGVHHLADAQVACQREQQAALGVGQTGVLLQESLHLAGRRHAAHIQRRVGRRGHIAVRRHQNRRGDVLSAPEHVHLHSHLACLLYTSRYSRAR